MSSVSNSVLYRKLPSIDELLRREDIRALAERDGLAIVTDAIRVVLEGLRDEITDGLLNERSLDLGLSGLTIAVERELRQALRYSLRPVINATGVVLHTNLGRAPLADAALDHARAASTTYSNLEFNLETGERGKRDVHVDRLFQRLFEEHGSASAAPVRAEGLESTVSTIVVNNNAAAVLLALNSLAEGGEVIVSRGELVEIGGSFRIPEVMSKSQATLREVGTTNRTRIGDYERAINERTRLLLRVHRSNFAITGFTEQPSLEELATLARARNIPLFEDLGSGALFDLREIGVANEANVFDGLRTGIDVVTYSGDKLLGGPQAGLVTGRADLVERMRSNSLFRALRVDKLTYAALEATLLAYVKRDYSAVPVLRMMHLSKDEISARADAVVSQIAAVTAKPLLVETLDGESVIGGGAAPTAVLPTRLIALTHRELTADKLCARLRKNEPPIVGRVEEGRVLLDLRTVFPSQDALVAAALNSVI
ncbi:MAG TPA: L-seryl-tRNA(Sec) selenium transferase [Terriglobales bacterium]|nr:L-seryl-tRNA(Sec) selenium transferase [Terriglobales bacterium]